MSGYLINFIVYTTAMIGIIFLAVWVYKTFSCNSTSKSKFLNVEDCINLAPRKSLYVVRAGNERFLVASDAERTSLISKLDDNIETKIDTKFEDSSVEDLPSIVSLPKRNESKKVFKNIVNNL
jgi:flagellar biogenesis protein FliO